MEYSIYKSLKALTNKWWISLVIGILLVIIGIYILRTPLASYISLSILFSIAIFIMGLSEVSFSITHRKHMDGWGWQLAGGIFDLLIGMLLISNPVLTIAILPYYVGFWLLFRAIMGIGTSFQLKSLNVEGWGWLLTIGIATLLFSFLLLANPIFVGLGIVLMTAFAFIMLGVFNISLAFQLNKIRRRIMKSNTIV